MKTKTTKTNKLKLLPAIILLIASVSIAPAQAQVTVGNDEEPAAGALLQLKDKTKAEVGADNVNASKGLAFPRVSLSHRKNLFPMFGSAGVPDANYNATTKPVMDAEHTGMMVYNMFESLDTESDPDLMFKPGFYYWDGEKWLESSTGSMGGACAGQSVFFTGGLTSPIMAVLGTGIGLTTVGVAGNGTVLGLGIDLKVAGVDMLELNLEDLGLGSYIEATSDGYLSEIDVNMNVTQAVSLGLAKYNFKATLYEAPAGSGTYKKVSVAVVTLFENQGPSTILNLTIISGPISGKATFSSGAIPITKGNKYAIVFTLNPESGFNVAADILGTISGSMSIECNQPVTPAALVTRNGLHIDTEDGKIIFGLGDNPLVEPTVIDQNGNSFDIITGTDTLDIIGSLKTDTLYLDEVQLAGDDHLNLAWDPDTKKVGYVAASTTPDHWVVSGSTLSSGYEDNVWQDGQVTIGKDTLIASAALNVEAGDGNVKRGVLLPRVALDSIKDKTTILNPADGLLVYNTGNGENLGYVGYVFWNGNEWMTLSGGSLAPGTIGSITCNSITLTPSVYEAGEPFEGTMIVPYTGSNGGVYPAQTIGPVNGLTATLTAGNFSAGAGSLAYTITGIPTVTTPETTAFPINIGGKTCEAIIGAGDGIAPGDLVYYSSPEIPANIPVIASDRYTGNVADCWLSYYDQDNLPVIGGKLRLDGYYFEPVIATGTISFQPRLVNTSGQNVKFWFSAMSTAENFNSANVVIKPGDWVNLDNGIYNGFGANSTMNNPTTGSNTSWNAPNAQTEVITLDFSLDDKWYRAYYYPIVDNKEQTNGDYMKRKVYISIQRLY